MRISLTAGPELVLSGGLPPKFSGSLFEHVNPFHAVGSFGYIVIQEINLPAMQLTKVLVNWQKPERIVCHLDHPCSMFTRTGFSDNLHHYVKGTGEIHVLKDQFVTLAASSWKNVILPEKAGEYSFLDISWSSRFVEEVITAGHALNERIGNINCEGFPESMFGVPLDNNNIMKIILTGLQHIDFSDTDAELTLRRNMKVYFVNMLEEIVRRNSIRNKMRVSDWDTINAAKVMIDKNPTQQYSVSEISSIVGMNEFKLKKLFPKITGKNIDEYRKYQLCIKAGKRIVQHPEEPLKNFYADAGYTSLTAFIKGFKKLCCCKPGELRQESWDLQTLRNVADE